MGVADTVLIAARELALFAAAGFLIGGVDEVLIDLAWAARAVRRLFVFRQRPRATVASLPPPAPGRFAVFIPAWDESTVIGAMLRHLLASFGDCAVYVAVYPNDPATRAILAQIDDPRLRVAITDNPGPTTKADALNTLWRAMLADEARDASRFRGVVLHDAEDVVHPDELRVFASLIDRFALIQLPVMPLVDPRSRWVAGTYLDEFAEHHGKTLLAREETGAGVPSAGVGCVFEREALGRIAGDRDGPFDAASLTEDYELGLRLRAAGGRAAFVRIDDADGRLVATQEHFPASYDAAVRQRARWIAGIALHGWDRLQWQGGIAERWMRARDRRSLIAAFVLLAGYLALILWIGLTLATGRTAALALPAWLTLAVTLLMLWRIGVRAAFVTRRMAGGRDCSAFRASSWRTSSPSDRAGERSSSTSAPGAGAAWCGTRPRTYSLSRLADEGAAWPARCAAGDRPRLDRGACGDADAGSRRSCAAAPRAIAC